MRTIRDMENARIASVISILRTSPSEIKKMRDFEGIPFSVFLEISKSLKDPTGVELFLAYAGIGTSGVLFNGVRIVNLTNDVLSLKDNHDIFKPINIENIDITLIDERDDVYYIVEPSKFHGSGRKDMLLPITHEITYKHHDEYGDLIDIKHTKLDGVLNYNYKFFDDLCNINKHVDFYDDLSSTTNSSTNLSITVDLKEFDFVKVYGMFKSYIEIKGRKILSSKINFDKTNKSVVTLGFTIRYGFDEFVAYCNLVDFETKEDVRKFLNTYGLSEDQLTIIDFSKEYVYNAIQIIKR